LGTGALSRRHALIGSAALSLLPWRAAAQQITANASLEKAPDPNQDAANIAAHTDANDHLTIEVRVNGTPYRFGVDTGAERSVIADDVAAALGLTLGPNVTVDGISSRIQAPTVKIGELAFGPFKRKNVTIPVLPRASLMSDGYLGLDAIDGTKVTFDFKNRALNIEQPHYNYMVVPDNPLSTSLSLSGKNGHLRVTDCLVDSIPASAFIDTGAEVSVGNMALYRDLLQRNKNLFESGAMVLTGVTGGQITAQILPIKRIKLHDLSFTDGNLAVADVPDFETWKLVNYPALLIGMDYLRQFSSVSIDYRAKEVRFEISLVPPPYRLPGVEINENV
jgi:predicted aspartyl protease